MKKIKRIIAIVLLILIVVAVGYLVFTGSQLSAYDTGGVYETIENI